MAREERDPYETRNTRAPQRGDTEATERPGARRPASSDPLNPDWRGARVTRRNSRSQGIPSSRQEFALWLQYGGWRIVAVAAALVVLLVLMLYVSRMPRQALPTAQPTAVAFDQGSGVGVNSQTIPLATSGISPTLAPVANAGGGARFRVVNTGAEGLFLRPDHSSDGPPIKTLPDGSVVTIVGQDYIAPDRVWKNVRDAEGSQGWVAADYLEAVQ
ncbi:MAG: SH3 domain-containing protein [Chloroflexi bacterium SZAS-1]|jgi:hypothetical protein|nr:SH3 domain-containing protein [Chloroflexi bacterium SZAS-1]